MASRQRAWPGNLKEIELVDKLCSANDTHKQKLNGKTLREQRSCFPFPLDLRLWGHETQSDKFGAKRVVPLGTVGTGFGTGSTAGFALRAAGNRS